MANRHQSAIKAARQSLKRQERNRSILRRVKTFMKKVDVALQEKNSEAAKSSLREATSELHKAASKGTTSSQYRFTLGIPTHDPRERFLGLLRLHPFSPGPCLI